MPGSEIQNSMFKKTVRGYRQKNHPFAVTSCGRRRNLGSPIHDREKPHTSWTQKDVQEIKESLEKIEDQLYDR